MQARTRAKATLEQHRRRGRVAFGKLLGRFVLEGKLDAEDVELVCKYARVVPPKCVAVACGARSASRRAAS